MDKQYILLDLDGTLTDSAEGILNSFAYALNKYNIHVEDYKDLRKIIGPPLKDSFIKYYDFNEDTAEEAVEQYRVYFKEKGMLENTVYENIDLFLKTLYDNGKTLIVATSKPTIFSKQILEHFNLAKYFKSIIGSNLDGSRMEKSDVIKYALESNNIVDLSKVIMIGDRKYDILGAKENNIQSIGVLYGYGSYDELHSNGADYIVRDVKELLALFM